MPIDIGDVVQLEGKNKYAVANLADEGWFFIVRQIDPSSTHSAGPESLLLLESISTGDEKRIKANNDENYRCTPLKRREEN